MKQHFAASGTKALNPSILGIFCPRDPEIGARIMIAQDRIFAAGVLKTLQSISSISKNISEIEVIYREIIKANDVEVLCQVARSNNLLEKSGLVNFGYAVSEEDANCYERLKEISPEDRRKRERRILSAAQKGDPEAKILLILDYEVVINTILRRKFGWFLNGNGRHLQGDDLRQEARYAVLKALQRYDENREDANFRSLVELVIVSYLHNVISHSEAIVSYPQKIYRENIANILNSTVPAVNEGGEDVIENICDESAHQNIFEFAEKSEFGSKVQTLMWFLPDREHFMLRIFFGFDGEPMSKAAIAKDRGESISAVTAILDDALDTLRCWIISGKTPRKPHKPDLKRLSRRH